MLVPNQVTLDYWIYSNAKTNFSSTNTSGKWCIILSSTEINSAWSIINSLVNSCKLIFAKVSTKKFNKSSYIICVYTNDYNDIQEVFNTRHVLRENGFTQELYYKRDIDSINGIEIKYYID